MPDGLDWVQDPPNPPGSPLEKIKTARERLLEPIRMDDYFRYTERVDPDMAQVLDRAFREYDRKKNWQLERWLDEEESWLNRHVHPGGGRRSREYDSFIMSLLPIFWYRMDGENVTEPVLDKSGNGHDATNLEAGGRTVDSGYQFFQEPVPLNAIRYIEGPGDDGGQTRWTYADNQTIPMRTYAIWMLWDAIQQTPFPRFTVFQSSGSALSTTRYMGGRYVSPVELNFLLSGEWSHNVTKVGMGTFAPELAPNTWHHLVCTWDLDESRLYMDGQLSSVVEGPFDFDFPIQGRLCLGSATNNFGGRADEWNGAIAESLGLAKKLEPEEVETLFYAGLDYVDLGQVEF